MKLYYSRGACSLVVRIIINEIGLACEYEAVDLKTKQTEHGANFLLTNAKGAVPTLEIEQGKILTENAVILQYLADTNGSNQLLPAIGDFKRYRVLEWINYVSTELHKTAGAMFSPAIPQDIKESVYIPLIKTKLAYVNGQLEGKQYLAGDHFTLPDAYCFVILMWVKHFNISLADYPNLQAYFTRIGNHPSVQKSLTQEGINKV